MNAKIGIVFILFLAAFQEAASKCASNDLSTVDTCYQKYFNKLGVSLPYNFNNYYYRVKHYYMTSLPGVDNLCNAFGTLQYCIVKDCMNPTDFAKVPIVGSDTSQQYIGDYFGLDYMCGDGNNHYKNAFDCLSSNVIGKSCTGYANDCTSRLNENICFTNDVKRLCPSNSEATLYVNTSQAIVLCHSRPECLKCPSGNGANTVTGLVTLVVGIVLSQLFL